MATWVAHMRLAEYFMNRYPALDNTEFLAGNIAPDCGVPNGDWSAFDPPKDITHYHMRLPDGKLFIDAEAFRAAYPPSAERPFFAGYYFHLLTDVLWSAMYNRKKLESPYRELLERDSANVWIIKNDWYGQDHLYLRRNPDCVFFTRFVQIGSFENTYLDFFPADAFMRQFEYIKSFYLNAQEDENREFPYLSRDEMDAFVAEAALTIESRWQELCGEPSS